MCMHLCMCVHMCMSIDVHVHLHRTEATAKMAKPPSPIFLYIHTHTHTHTHQKPGPGQLRLAGRLTPPAWVVVGLFLPISYPISTLLDCCCCFPSARSDVEGDEANNKRFTAAELAVLLEIHQEVKTRRVCVFFTYVRPFVVGLMAIVYMKHPASMTLFVSTRAGGGNPPQAPAAGAGQRRVEPQHGQPAAPPLAVGDTHRGRSNAADDAVSQSSCEPGKE